MRKYIVVLCMSIIISMLKAQGNDEKLYRLTTSTDIVNLSTVELLDPYLSPLGYSGLGMGYQHSDMKYFPKAIHNLSYESRFSVLGALTLNPQYTSSMTYVGGSYKWGVFYHLRPIPGLQLLAGGNIGALAGMKSNARNVNNPINVDAAVDLNLSGIVRYDFPLRRRTLRLSCFLDIPVMGIMYVPMQGASYYEMFSLGNLSNAVHFSSLHNRLGKVGGLKLDVPFKRSTWNFGLSTSTLKYKANEMVFKQNTFNLNLGVTYDLYVFSGMKNPAPKNFISTNL